MRRAAPSETAPALGHLPRSLLPRLTAADDTWARLSLYGRELGFVPRSAVHSAKAGYMPDGLSPGQGLRDCPRCPELVVIAPGRVRMGGTAAGPTVIMPRAFALGRYEVTRAEWQACVEAKACRPARGSDGDSEKPVGNLLWRSALDYVRWLSFKTGRRYRLPSEAEWEYAARAGSEAEHYWGGDTAAACRFANLADGGACSDGFAELAPVGRYAANAWGLYDMLGNVWEWVDDCWNDGLEGLPAFGQSRRSGQCGQHLLRGGSAEDGPEVARLGYRGRHEQATLSGGRFNPYFGLRVLRELD
jgi:formylglycine-generating enzyme required for sulfatase activity